MQTTKILLCGAIVLALISGCGGSAAPPNETLAAGTKQALSQPHRRPEAAPADPGAIVSALHNELGERAAAGIYLDESGKLIVNVLDDVSASIARAHGAEPRYVKNSGALLQSVMAALHDPRTPIGTSWFVDAKANVVRVQADPDATPADLAVIRALVARFGDAVRVEQAQNRMVPISGPVSLSGGIDIEGDGSGYGPCTLGFNLWDARGHGYVITAGHCSPQVGNSWYSDPARDTGSFVGTVVETHNPQTVAGDTQDYSLIRFLGTASTQEAMMINDQGYHVPVSGVGTAVQGQQIIFRGRTSGVHTGTIAVADRTYYIALGNYQHFIEVDDACASIGDSGGPLVFGGVQVTALGILNRASLCPTNGVLFQAIASIVSAHGLQTQPPMPAMGVAYRLVNMASGKNMGLQNHNTAVGTQIVISSGGGIDQQWTPYSVGNGYYNLRTAGGFNMDSGGYTAIGAPLWTWYNITGNTNQWFKIDTYKNNGYVRLSPYINPNANPPPPTQALDLYGGVTTDNNPIDQWYLLDDSPNQLWQFIPVQ